MKLFLREHLLLIVLQVLQFTLFGSIMWLGGFRNSHLIFYSIFIGLFFLVCYLIYHYYSRKHYYNRLMTRMTTLDESQLRYDQAPIAKALKELLQSQYNLYEETIMQLQNKQDEHLRFLDRSVHQMKTPLSVIELMAKDLDEPASSDLREEIDRIKDGLSTVLYMGRLRSIQHDFHVKMVELRSIIQEVNKDNKRYYIRNDVYPVVHFESEQISVESDEKWLYFIVTQIVQNAVKYSAGVSKQIRFNIYKRGNETVLEIEDDGIGIPAHDVKRIFEPFFTGENGRKYRESTGVGLFIVKEAATYLGHKLEIDSEVGKGTVFRIIFNS